jgi:hypothetical protein
MVSIFFIQLFIFIYYLFWIISIIGFGSIVLYFKNIDKIIDLSKNLRVTILGFFGFIIISIIGLILNFFIPLNYLFSIILLFIGLVIFFYNNGKIFYLFEKFEYFLIILTAIYFSFFIFTYCKTYDTGLYHLSAINWIKESKVPLGLANLSTRLAFNSTWFIIEAVLEPLKILTGKVFFI